MEFYCCSLGESVKILVALSILFTYGLQFTVPSEIVWKKISHKIKEANHDKCYYLMRALMILGTGQYTIETKIVHVIKGGIHTSYTSHRRFFPNLCEELITIPNQLVLTFS
jgi:hypothetical protein